MTRSRLRTRRGQAGQTLAEVGIVMPLLLLLIFGMLEVGWAIYQMNTMRGYAREASNLISRNETIHEAEAAIISASNAGGPIRIGPGNADSRMILSVVTLGANGVNDGEPIILRRHSVGDLPGNSVLGDPSPGLYEGPPFYTATNTANPSIRAETPLPNGYVLPAGQSLFVTEIFTRRGLIVNIEQIPDTLYASAFF